MMQQFWGWGSPTVAMGSTHWGAGTMAGVGHACAQSGEGQCRKGNSLGPGKGSGCRERKSSRRVGREWGVKQDPPEWQGGAKEGLVGTGHWGSLTPAIKGEHQGL